MAMNSACLLRPTVSASARNGDRLKRPGLSAGTTCRAGHRAIRLCRIYVYDVYFPER